MLRAEAAIPPKRSRDGSASRKKPRTKLDLGIICGYPGFHGTSSTAALRCEIFVGAGVPRAAAKGEHSACRPSSTGIHPLEYKEKRKATGTWVYAKRRASSTEASLWKTSSPHTRISFAGKTAGRAPISRARI